MSYRSLRTNHYWYHISRSAALTNDSINYATINGTAITAGFPYDWEHSSNGITWNSTKNGMIVPVAGLYMINVGFNIFNNNNTSGDDTINVGFTVSNAADDSHSYFTQPYNPEYFASGFKSSVHAGICRELSAGQIIRGCVFASETTITYATTDNGRVCNYLSIALISRFD